MTFTDSDLQGFPSSSAPTFRANLVTYLASKLFTFLFLFVDLMEVEQCPTCPTPCWILIIGSYVPQISSTFPPQFEDMRIIRLSMQYIYICLSFFVILSFIHIYFVFIILYYLNILYYNFVVLFTCKPCFSAFVTRDQGTQFLLVTRHPPGGRPELPTADRWLQGAPLTCHGFIHYVPCQGMPRNKTGLLYERNMEQIL